MTQGIDFQNFLKSCELASFHLLFQDPIPINVLGNLANHQQWHLFYITNDGYLVDWVNSNLTRGWTLGTLRSGNYKASNSSSVGLTVCVCMISMQSCPTHRRLCVQEGEISTFLYLTLIASRSTTTGLERHGTAPASDSVSITADGITRSRN
jgi:hypothetical protein